MQINLIELHGIKDIKLIALKSFNLRLTIKKDLMISIKVRLQLLVFDCKVKFYFLASRTVNH
jgi:hypothetical protein